MNKQDPLFKLIKSMTPQEIRHFLSNSKKNKAENYLELFEIISSLSNYDEEAIKQRLSNRTFAKNLAAGKNYLYQLLLKSLRSNYAGSKLKSARFLVKEHLQNIYLFQEKGLLAELQKELKKAKKLAETFALDFQLLELLVIEREILGIYNRKKLSENLNPLRDQTKFVLNNVSNRISLMDCSEDLLIQIREKKKAQENSSFHLENQLIKREAKSFSWMEYYWNLSHSHHFYFEKNFKMANEHLGNILRLFEINEKVKVEYLDKYVNVLNNYFSNCIEGYQLQEIPALLEKLDQLDPPSYHLRVKVLQHKYYYKILYFLIEEDYNSVIQMEGELMKILKQYEPHFPLNRKITYLYNLGVAHFMEFVNNQTNLEKKKIHLEGALDRLNQIEAEPKFETRYDIKRSTKFLMIIIHFELGNESLAENKILMYQYYIKKHKILESSEESLVIKYLKKIINIFSAKDRAQIFETIYRELESNNSGAALRIKQWIKPKIAQNTPLSTF